MGYGCYSNITDIKGVLGITATTDDTVLRKIAESASRAIDQYCNRNFYVTSATKYFDGSGRTLWIPDMLSNSTFKTDDTGDGTYENVLEGTWVASTAYTVGQFVKPTTENRHSYKCTTAGTTNSTEPTWGTTLAGTTTDNTVIWTCSPTNYTLYGGGLEDSYNKLPKTRVEINPNGEYGSFANGVGIGIEITGVWGYGDGISATPYVIDTTISEALDTSETGVDVTAITNLNGGNTILIDSEQMYVYSYATLTLTVERGVNGTTAAEHGTSTSLYIYQYPSDIRQACIDLSVALYQNRAKQGLQSERLGDYEYTVRGAAGRGGEMLSKGMIESMLDDTIKSYRRLRM